MNTFSTLIFHTKEQRCCNVDDSASLMFTLFKQIRKYLSG
ncbi:hypothetical protein JCM19240_607 [Vibrio maritimus]|uniref:Uncharacterized protein n=1 Tax=Vibrio maritimus TaxID=990268 RepID=A0A090T6Y9_9VIBR|nr:hypothetical protein JCM19240_607 [Vibrio maritimus]